MGSRELDAEVCRKLGIPLDSHWIDDDGTRVERTHPLYPPVSISPEAFELVAEALAERDLGFHVMVLLAAITREGATVTAWHGGSPWRRSVCLAVLELPK